MGVGAFDGCCRANAAGSPVSTGAEHFFERSLSWPMRVDKLNPCSLDLASGQCADPML